jgi:hypothetical protein
LLEPLTRELLANIGVIPDRSLADAGYFSESTVKLLSAQFPGTKWLIPPDRGGQTEGEIIVRGRIPKNISVKDRMRRELSTKRGKAQYGQRKAIVEPVFGQIKEAGVEFRRFSLRGHKNTNREWLLVCTVHNLLKMMRNWQGSKKQKPCANNGMQAAA